jgi:hypothetical protein
MASTQHCPQCDRDLPFDAFAPRYKDKPHYRHTYCRECSALYMKNWWKQQPPSANPLAKTLQEYFDKYVTPGNTDACWEWQGSRNPNGYGITCFQRKREGAHVVAYVLHYGAVPEGLCVLHRCDNRPCCNWNHLWAGTHYDNTIDALIKGRRGKITSNQIEEIRQLFDKNMPIKAISRQTGIPYSTCYYILHRPEHKVAAGR